jgi:cobalt-zinc-cadmium efflux system membrane fusion protein
MNEIRGIGALRSLWREKWASHAWPLLAAAVIILLIIAFVLGRSRSAEPENPTATANATAGDSVVLLDSASLSLVNIEMTAALPAGSGGLLANGTITFDANHVSVIAPRAEGRISSVLTDLGQQVRRGAVLAFLESADIGQTRGDVERSRANMEVSRANYERERRLYEESVSSQKDMLDAQAAYRSAEADYKSALARLNSLGASGGNGATYGLATPIAGTVVERNAMPGQIVGPTTNLFTVADLSRVWITVDLYEADANRVHPGTVAVVSPRSLPGDNFTARVTFTGGVVDTVTHTVKLRLEVSNPDRRLRPGMFAEVRFETALQPADTSGRSGVMVPEDAVQDVNGKSVVFVPGGVRGLFIVRPVIVSGTTIGRMVTVTSGLKSGEQVVVKGAFQLKAELTKGSFGEDQDER